MTHYTSGQAKSQVEKSETVPCSQARTRDNGLRFKVRLVNLVAGISGILADRLRAWSSKRDIRKAVQAEVHLLLVTLNFYILRAIENPQDDSHAVRYFSEPLQLQSFVYYWQEHRDELLKLQEWPQLKNFNETLGGLGRGPDPTLFTAIMLFEQLLIPPLDRCVSRQSKKFARRVLDRHDVDAYKMDYLLRKSGVKKD